VTDGCSVGKCVGGEDVDDEVWVGQPGTSGKLAHIASTVVPLLQAMQVASSAKQQEAPGAGVPGVVVVDGQPGMRGSL